MKIKIKPYNQSDPISPDQMDELMAIEYSCFREQIQEDEDGKRELLQTAQAVLFAYDNHDGRIIGEAYCITEVPEVLLKDESPDACHYRELFEQMDLEDSIYFMSLAVLPDYQGKGIAGQLINDMVLLCKELEFNYLYTHAKVGASAHLFGKYGEFVEERKNWFSTGDDYLLFRISLQES